MEVLWIFSRYNNWLQLTCYKHVKACDSSHGHVSGSGIHLQSGSLPHPQMCAQESLWAGVG